MHLSFLTSHNLLFFRFCKTSKKKNIFGFLSFFIVKSPKSQSLKLNISRTAWPILMILVSFRRILNGLSDEINLFWRCSSPLKVATIEKKIRSEIMQCIRTNFVFETVNCFLDVFFKSPKLISILYIPQTIPLFQSNYILSSMDFIYVLAMGQYTRGEGGQGRKPKLRQERRSERHKSSENAQEK